MTNTLNNVPRELTIERYVFGAMHIKLEDFDFIQIQYQYPYTDNASTKALAERITALLSAPSPAGVDGLEEVGLIVKTGPKTQICFEQFGNVKPDSVVPLCRLSDAQAVIDGLRGEVACLAVQLDKSRKDNGAQLANQAAVIGQRDQLAALLRESLTTLEVWASTVGLRKVIAAALSNLPE